MPTEQMYSAVVVVAHRMYDTLNFCLAGFRAGVSHPQDLIFDNLRRSRYLFGSLSLHP